MPSSQPRRLLYVASCFLPSALRDLLQALPLRTPSASEPWAPAKLPALYEEAGLVQCRPALPTPAAWPGVWPQGPCRLLPGALTPPDALVLPSRPRSDARRMSSEHLTLAFPVGVFSFFVGLRDERCISPQTLCQRSGRLIPSPSHGAWPMAGAQVKLCWLGW